MWNYEEFNPEKYIDQFGKDVLKFLGVGSLPTDRNPITDALKMGDQFQEGSFIEAIAKEPWFNPRTCRMSLSKAATLCQMRIYNERGGPDGDRQRKGLRRQWYSWYKTNFAQPLDYQISIWEAKDKGLPPVYGEFDGTLWAGRMSKTYAFLVDECGATYWDLWVSDMSRMMQRIETELFPSLHLLLAVEKDSLFKDFVPAAQALGARAIISGKGKNSKAAMELLLRDHFEWRQDQDPFSPQNPLVILHISDWDMDGHAVIGPTFGEQARRYTPHILEARVGINPSQHPQEEWTDNWYDVKVTDQGYENWSERYGLFLASCACGHSWPVMGTRVYDPPMFYDKGEEEDWSRDHICLSCGDLAFPLLIKMGKRVQDQPKGFEVESLPTRAYYEACVDALLQVIPFDLIVDRLRDHCVADTWTAVDRIINDIKRENVSYQAITKVIDTLQDVLNNWESDREIYHRLMELAEEHKADWREEEQDPSPEEFKEHLRDSSGSRWVSVWRPFSVDVRTDALVDFLMEEEEDWIRELTEEKIRARR